MTSGTGILAIWNHCRSGMEAEYEAWYQTEHLLERLSIAGFQRGRRYEAIGLGGGYFTYYETDRPEVLTSNTYLHHVNKPTPMTQRIMRDAMIDMSRTVCKRAYMQGQMRGAFAATLQTAELPPEAYLNDWAGSAARHGSIARLEGWQAVSDGLPESTEAQLRGGDARIESCLLVETLRESDCLKALDHLVCELGISDAKTGIYHLLCDLTSY